MSQLHYLARQFAGGTWDRSRPIFTEWCERHGIDAAALPDLGHCLRLVVDDGDTFLVSRVTDADGHHTGSMSIHLKDGWVRMRGTIGNGAIRLRETGSDATMIAASLPAALWHVAQRVREDETLLAVPSPNTLYGACSALPRPAFVLADNYTAVAHAVEKLASEDHMAGLFLAPGLQKHIDFIRSRGGACPPAAGADIPLAASPADEPAARPVAQALLHTGRAVSGG